MDTLPVIDENGRLVGLITIMDVAQIFFPDFVSLLPNIDFVKDFGARKRPSTGSLEIAEILLVRDIMEKPVAVEEDNGLLGCGTEEVVLPAKERNVNDAVIIS